MLYVCNDPKFANKFFLKNNCNTTIDVQVEYIPVGKTSWVTHKSQFSPGHVTHLADTRNRFVFVTAHSVGGNRSWARHKVDLGNKLGTTFTHKLSCQ